MQSLSRTTGSRKALPMVHDKTEVQREYHLAWNAWKRCCKKVDSQGEHITGIHDRFLKDPVCRESQLAIGWSEQKCKEWDELAKEDLTYKLTPENRRRYKGQWYLILNKAGKNGPMKLRSDYRAAVYQMDKLCSSSKVPNWTNQIQTHIMIEQGNPLSGATQGPRKVEEKRPIPRRSKHVLLMKNLWNMIERGNPLSAVTQITSQKHPEHVPLMKAPTSSLETKQIMIERGNPLFAVTKVTSQVASNQCWTRSTLTSEYLDCHILLWNKLRTFVFVNWSRRSRTTLTYNLFNEIYNKTKPTTRSVRRQRKWIRTWATQSFLNCSRRTLRRSAKNAYHTGVEASSIAHAGISWKKQWPIEVSLNIHWTFFQLQNK